MCTCFVLLRLKEVLASLPSVLGFWKYWAVCLSHWMLACMWKRTTVMMTISVCRTSTVDSSPSAARLVLNAGQKGVKDVKRRKRVDKKLKEKEKWSRLDSGNVFWKKKKKGWIAFSILQNCKWLNLNKELVFGTFSLFIWNDHKCKCWLFLPQTCAMFCIGAMPPSRRHYHPVPSCLSTISKQ